MWGGACRRRSNHNAPPSKPATGDRLRGPSCHALNARTHTHTRKRDKDNNSSRRRRLNKNYPTCDQLRAGLDQKMVRVGQNDLRARIPQLLRRQALDRGLVWCVVPWTGGSISMCDLDHPIFIDARRRDGGFFHPPFPCCVIYPTVTFVPQRGSFHPPCHCCVINPNVTFVGVGFFFWSYDGQGLEGPQTPSIQKTPTGMDI